MLNKAGVRELARTRRQTRVRKKVRGTAAHPRLSVFKSARHVYAQLIDDVRGETLVAASSLSPPIRERLRSVEKASGSNVRGAKVVGEWLAELTRAQGITRLVFDRNGFLYHGRVKAVAEAVRAAGLQF